MSIEALGWAQKMIPLLANDAQKLVLYHLSNSASPDGLVWPSIYDISMGLGKSRRAVQRALKELESEDVMSIRPDFRTTDGSQKSNYYHLFLSLTPDEYLKRRSTGQLSDAYESNAKQRRRFHRRLQGLLSNIELWGQALAIVKSQIDQRSFHTWYTPLRFRGIQKKTLSLIVPNENFITYHNDKRLRKMLLAAIGKVFTAQPITHVYFRIQK